MGMDPDRRFEATEQTLNLWPMPGLMLSNQVSGLMGSKNGNIIHIMLLKLDFNSTVTRLFLCSRNRTNVPVDQFPLTKVRSDVSALRSVRHLACHQPEMEPCFVSLSSSISLPLWIDNDGK